MSYPQKFLILAGAPKTGTTSVTNWLLSRPDVHSTLHKEPRFFTDFGDISWAGPHADRFPKGLITDETAYLEGFGACAKQDWGIDASTDYMWCDSTPDRLDAWSKRYEVKVVCILRDPIERAVSEYQHTIRDGLQRGGFLQSLEQEDERFANHWHPLFYHRRRSSYYDRLCLYREMFKENFLAVDYAELKDPGRLREKLEHFLGLSAMEIAEPPKANAAGDYRSRWLAAAMRGSPFRSALRGIVPQNVRPWVRKTINSLNNTEKKYRPKQAEIAFLQDALGEDIRKCRQDPLIPTDSWKTA